MILPSAKKIITLCILCAFTAQMVAPLSASALIGPVPVSDGQVRSKEVGFTVFGVTLVGVTYDSVIIFAVKRLLEAISDNVVEWINSGFDGNPMFATDLRKFTLDIGDQVAGNYIQSIGAGALCSPFRFQVRAALQANYRTQRTNPRNGPAGGSCTISGIAGNIQNFFDGDFTAGGWQRFFEVSQNPNNNVYGSAISAQSELQFRINNVNVIESEKLRWAKGFLSTQDCLEYEKVVDPNYTGPTQESNLEPITDLPMVNGPCKKPGPVKTPGTIIESQLQKTLGSEVSQLELADEFDEIVSALIGQLIGTVFNSRGIINNSGNRWAGGGFGGGAGSQNGNFICTPDKDTGLKGDTIKWEVRGQNLDAEFLWSGSDGLSGTGPTASITYAQGGDKTAGVLVSQTITVSGVSTIKPPETVNCKPLVKIANFGELGGQCYLTLAQSLIQFPGVGIKRSWVAADQKGSTEPLVWLVKVNGGSGKIARYMWAGSRDNGTAELPSAGTDTPGLELHYIKLGEKKMEVKLIDDDQTVEQKTISCGTIDVI